LAERVNLRRREVEEEAKAAADVSPVAGVYELYPEIVQKANLQVLQMIMSQQQSLLLSL
jgi:hypothetical protein